MISNNLIVTESDVLGIGKLFRQSGKVTYSTIMAGVCCPPPKPIDNLSTRTKNGGRKKKRQSNGRKRR